MTVRLSLPDDWAARYLHTHRPELFHPTRFESARLHLSVDPRRDYECDLAQVAADLAAGVLLEERSGRQGSYYLLRGAYHQVFLNPGIGRNSGVAIAKVGLIKDGDGLGVLP
jgi:hypothetical protein